MGFVIGKQGNTIKQIQEQSGAKVTSPRSEDKRSGFMVRGNEEQIARAKELIIKKAVSDFKVLFRISRCLARRPYIKPFSRLSL